MDNDCDLIPEEPWIHCSVSYPYVRTGHVCGFPRRRRGSYKSNESYMPPFIVATIFKPEPRFPRQYGLKVREIAPQLPGYQILGGNKGSVGWLLKLSHYTQSPPSGGLTDKRRQLQSGAGRSLGAFLAQSSRICSNS